jgi:hypothetical protein
VVVLVLLDLVVTITDPLGVATVSEGVLIVRAHRLVIERLREVGDGEGKVEETNI